MSTTHLEVHESFFDTPESQRRAETEMAPSHEHREKLKRQLDALNEQAETLAAQLETERADPKNLRPIRDESVRAQDPDLAIRHPDPNFVYDWVYRDPFNKFGGRTVHTYETRGWEVVHVGDADAKDMRPGPDGTVVNADCLLMRRRVDVDLIAKARDKSRRLAIQEGVPSNLQELADRRGVNVSDLSGDTQSTMAAASQRRMAARRQAAGIMNSPALARDIRAGTIPGMPAPGR